KNIDVWVDVASECFPIICRAGAENFFQYGIKTVISRAKNNLLGVAMFCSEVDQVTLDLRQLRKITAHVVEQQAEDIWLKLINFIDFLQQSSVFVSAAVEIDFVRA